MPGLIEDPLDKQAKRIAELEAENEQLQRERDAANNAWYECKKAADRLNAATALAAKQAEDDGLWFQAETVTEAHLQNALRELAEAIEMPNLEFRGATPEGGASPATKS